jgi:hypothetical protein
MDQVKAAIEVVNQCRKLPVLLETFLGTWLINYPFLFLLIAF